MKIPTLFAAWTALVFMAVSFESKGQDPDFKPPGTEENAAVDQANTRLDAVYKRDGQTGCGWAEGFERS